ncbi:uncharacterized [Tachysurus ichikawai]
MSHFFVGDLHGCYELRPLEVNSYMPLVAAHWNMAISAMDHCVSISATKADRLDGGGVNECETESVFSSRGLGLWARPRRIGCRWGWISWRAQGLELVFWRSFQSVWPGQLELILHLRNHLPVRPQSFRPLTR